MSNIVLDEVALSLLDSIPFKPYQFNYIGEIFTMYHIGTGTHEMFITLDGAPRGTSIGFKSVDEFEAHKPAIIATFHARQDAFADQFAKAYCGMFSNMDEKGSIKAQVTSMLRDGSVLNDRIAAAWYFYLSAYKSAENIQQPNKFLPRVLAVIHDDGIPSYNADADVEVFVFDARNPESVPTHFADLASAFDNIPVEGFPSPGVN